MASRWARSAIVTRAGCFSACACRASGMPCSCGPGASCRAWPPSLWHTPATRPLSACSRSGRGPVPPAPPWLRPPPPCCCRDSGGCWSGRCPATAWCSWSWCGAACRGCACLATSGPGPGCARASGPCSLLCRTPCWPWTPST
uniref:Uncharacterized protein n=1 Tax=Ixodes ricinus TaxID=34613 RepID=A0A6B0UTR9_IXORI